MHIYTYYVCIYVCIYKHVHVYMRIRHGDDVKKEWQYCWVCWMCGMHTKHVHMHWVHIISTSALFYKIHRALFLRCTEFLLYSPTPPPLMVDCFFVCVV